MTAALYVASAYAAVTVTVNGSSHTIPQTNERGWGTNVTAWIQSISQNTLQPSGGTFTLTADANFGANYGLVSPYFKSRNSVLSSAGVLRLGNTDTIGFRNNANSANLLLGVDTSDRLTFNAVPFLPSAALTASRALASDASGVVSASSVTLTELGYVSGVTSAIQTQINTKASTTDLNTHEADTTSIHGITDTSVLVTLAGAGTLTNKTIDADGTGNAISNIENADIKALAAIALSKLAVTTVSRALVSDGSGVIAPATTTSTEIGYVNGVTSAIQTQIDARQARSALTTKGDLYVATASATVTRQAIGTDTHVLTADSSLANGLKWAAPAAAPVRPAPTIQTFTSSSGTYNKNYAFVITSGSATVGATYTNNSITFTVYATVASSTLVYMRGSGAPSASGTLTKSAGTGDSTLTFSEVIAIKSLRVRLIGGGAGGSGSGTTPGSGNAGTDTTFSTLTAGGGVGADGAGGNNGGTATGGDINIVGGSGVTRATNGASAFGGAGGSGAFGGAGGGGNNGAVAGGAGATNSGGGGGGAGAAGTLFAGSGGGSGGYVEKIITSPAATYSYGVGASGGGGGAGSGGAAGGAGGSGIVIVEESY